MKYINIALATDDNYIVPITVVLQSLFDNNPASGIRIYLCYIEGNLKQENLRFFKGLVDASGNEFIPLEISENQLEVFPLTRHGRSTLLRLFLPTLLPEVDKILYLDGDIVITDKLRDIFSVELTDDEYIGAVKDTTPIYHPAYLAKLGIDPSHWYFNAGVTLLNLKAMRNIQLLERVIAFTKANFDHISAPDQDALNYVCQGHTHYLHPRYNMNYLVEKDVAKQTWGKKLLKEAKQHPCIIHYIGPVKPWSVLSVHPRRKLWWVYLRKTQFSNFVPKDKCFKNTMRYYYLLTFKSIEKHITLATKVKLGKLIPAGLKKKLKRSLLKSA